MFVIEVGFYIVLTFACPKRLDNFSLLYTKKKQNHFYFGFPFAYKFTLRLKFFAGNLEVGVGLLVLFHRKEIKRSTLAVLNKGHTKPWEGNRFIIRVIASY